MYGLIILQNQFVDYSYIHLDILLYMEYWEIKYVCMYKNITTFVNLKVIFNYL
jgi:hypothetical protein